MKEPKKSTVSSKEFAPPDLTASKRYVIAMAVLVYATVTWIILNVVDQTQPIPYLDEIYHVPQAQEYCKGNLTYWDNRITTLPGLYLISIGIMKPLSLVTGSSMCGTFHLRTINFLLSIGNFLLYTRITEKIHFPSRGFKNWKAMMSAINIAIFPPLYFFTFLYYTDMGAVFFVLLMYSLHLDGRNRWAALAGVVATLMRQTNIVWTIFVAIGCLDVSLRQILLSPKERVDVGVIHSWREIPALYRGLKRLLNVSNHIKMRLVFGLISRLLPFLVVGLIFVVFVWLNEGLVVGDRSAHQATLHVPQFFYFFALAAAFTGPHLYPLLKPFTVACIQLGWPLMFLSVTSINMIVRYNTIVHPYLLADNRHYTFYVWKRLFEYRPWVRFVLFPAYAFGAYAVRQILKQRQSFLFVTAFFLCTFVSLVPQRLLEIRYFFIPFVLFRLHVPAQSGAALVLEFLAFVVVNTAALYLFVARPFYWDDTPLVQRFMW